MRKSSFGFWQWLLVAGLCSLIWAGSSLHAASPGMEVPADNSTGHATPLVEYIVVSNEDWTAFQSEVTDKLSQGYGPIGGIAINSDGQPVQAMGR